MGEVFREFQQSRAEDLRLQEGADVASQLFVEIEGVSVHEASPVALVGVFSGRRGEEQGEEDNDAEIHGGCPGIWGWLTCLRRNICCLWEFEREIRIQTFSRVKSKNLKMLRDLK